VTGKGTSRGLAAAAAAIAGILVGTGIVATRFVIDQTAPASLAFLRYVIGVLCLLPPALMAGPWGFARRDLIPLAALGIGQFAVLIALLNFGLQFISSALGAVIFATFPMITLVLAAAFGREAVTLGKALGVALTLAGVAFALAPRLLAPAAGGEPWIGILAVFASAVTGALCSIFYRPYLQRYRAVQVSAFAMLASVAFLALLAAFEGFFAAAPRITAGGWLAVLFIGVSSGLGYFLWLWALRHSSPTEVTVFLSLSPITATALGALLLSEPVSLPFLVGLACVVLGLWLAFRHPRAEL